MRNKITSAVVGLAATSLALAVGGIARGEDGGSPPEPPSAGDVTLDDKTTDVTEALSANYDRPGFGSVVVDEEEHVVTIRWAGEIPDDIKSQVGDHDGVRVEVLPARYAEDELVAAATKILRSNREFAPEKIDEGVGSGQVIPGIRSIRPNHDRSGLVITLARDAYESRDSISFDALTDSERAIPLAYEIDATPARVGDLGRTNDAAPWQGGGAINKGGHHSCTVGFAVLTGSGSGRLLGAGHCADVGDQVKDGAGDVIGEVVREAVNFDSILIDPNAPPGVPATIGKVFTGGWASGTSKFVGGASAPSGSPSGGERVCTSGANSGQHCDLEILQTGVSRYCDLGQGICTGFVAIGPGLNSAGGDSGGPIYKMRDDGRVGARGVVNKAEGLEVTCSGLRYYNPSEIECYTGIFSVGIHQLLDRWSVRIET